MSKRKSLQPWLEYFEMLHTYEQEGYLEVEPRKHEAYITRAALYTLADASSSALSGFAFKSAKHAQIVSAIARRIRSYAAWCSQQGIGYLSWTFALHVVHDDIPHNLLCTILLTRRRVWWRLWNKAEKVEIINYEK